MGGLREEEVGEGKGGKRWGGGRKSRREKSAGVRQREREREKGNQDALRREGQAVGASGGMSAYPTLPLRLACVC